MTGISARYTGMGAAEFSQIDPEVSTFKCNPSIYLSMKEDPEFGHREDTRLLFEMSS